eukprot:CAMPEP_0184643736 /NCGR_PEP_ID=MMETSP0308-20130426/560_1 /TAXON_ID=38269 /ORGANISM="Gloeochaete witrockiana, Strain SAG 46.84" /LENGTH=174 /DNA_ID=CAMNT_0027071871 /DNA_START=617 /DNA_END=1142 /DNA_ORIENTATION=-
MSVHKLVCPIITPLKLEKPSVIGEGPFLGKGSISTLATFAGDEGYEGEEVESGDGAREPDPWFDEVMSGGEVTEAVLEEGLLGEGDDSDSLGKTLARKPPQARFTTCPEKLERPPYKTPWPFPTIPVFSNELPTENGVPRRSMRARALRPTRVSSLRAVANGRRVTSRTFSNVP